MANSSRHAWVAVVLPAAMALLVSPAGLWAQDDQDESPLPAAAEDNTGEPREPGQTRPFAVMTDKEIDELLANLPESWQDPGNLRDAAIGMNSKLAQAENNQYVIPWRLADGFCTSLLAGRELAERIDAYNRIAYFQALFMTALAAGRPDEALSAARALHALVPEHAYYPKCMHFAGMLMGDHKVCEEAVEIIKSLLPENQHRAVKGMTVQAETIGQKPDFDLLLSDGTTLNDMTAKGRVVVFDFWKQGNNAYTTAAPYVRKIHDMFRYYPDFRMVGVNLDSKEFRTIVKTYANVHKLSWPHYYEEKILERPVSMGIFRVRGIPRQVVVGPDGRILYHGMPNDPVLYYAIRAGLRKANGDKLPIPTSQPDEDELRTDDKPAPSTDTKPKPADVSKADQEKAASQMYRLGQTYESANLRPKAIEIYKQLIQKYPDTQAAVHAHSRLLTIEQYAP